MYNFEKVNVLHYVFKIAVRRGAVRTAAWLVSVFSYVRDRVSIIYDPVVAHIVAFNNYYMDKVFL